MRNSQKSIFFKLFVAISFTILIATFLISKIFYNSTKEHLILDVNSDVKTSLEQLKNSIYPFMDSYSVNEYDNLIENELKRSNILAIVVEDLNMAKFTGSKFIVGKININQRIEDFDENNNLHKSEMNNSYYSVKDDIYNQNSLRIGTIEIYASDTLINENLSYLVKISIIFALLSTFIVSLVIYFVIHKIVQKPMQDIIELINDKTADGIPTNKIPKYNSKELSILSDTLNNMIDSIKESRHNLNHNIAFLKSYELALDESSIVIKGDLEGNIVYANDYLYNISGLKPIDIIGKPYLTLQHEDNPKNLHKKVWEIVNNKKVWKGIFKNKGKLANYWVDSTILPILDENGNIVEFISVGYDITRIIKQQEQLDKISKTDMLTGLGNRYKLIHDINYSLNPALAIINIDNFSQLNDFYGYEQGDYIIKQVGLKLSKLNKNSNTNVYHIQGDEYVLFNPNMYKEEFEQNIIDLLESLNEISVKINDELLTFNFTIGISFEVQDKILPTADMALKVAKRTHDNIVIFTEEISLNKEYQNNIFWTKKIKQAIIDDSFVPVYQPIVNNKTKIAEKYESLVRLKDEDKLISPFFFLEISKKTKHYSSITKTMIEKTFERFKDNDLEFSLNLTIEDVLNKEIETFIVDILNKYNLGSRVVFEIVESESIENFEEVMRFLNIVKSFGCKIAIDDFGTGYSNFVYLMKLSPDYIKIDGSLIKEIDTNTQAQIVVSTIVDFAKKMNIKTIAEFVENEKILNKVIELDIDYSQGYFFSEPKLDI